MAKKISDEVLQDDIEQGAELFGLQTQSYGKFLIGVIERHESPKRLKAFGSGFGDDAKAALRAVQLGFVHVDDDDAWKIRKAILIAKVKDDASATELFANVENDTCFSWDDIKAMVRERNRKDTKPRAASGEMKNKMWALPSRNLDGTVTPMTLDRVWAIYADRRDATMFGNGMEPIDVFVTCRPVKHAKADAKQ